MPKQEPDLTIRDVAKLTQQSIDTVQKLVRQGRFPGAYKSASGAKNSPVRIPTTALEHFRNTAPLA
jgi:hypothetical protein